jgi:ribulose-phosphate 3-epimerase
MIENPTKWAAEFQKAGANSITMHIEALEVEKVEEAIALIKGLGLKVGLALKPDTPVETILPYLEQIDLALGMR